MGVPRARKTKGATRRRRSHFALSKINPAKCKNCGFAVMPHRVCLNCGYYRGGQVITTTTATAKPKPAK